MVDPEIGAAGDLDTALIVLRFKNGVIATIDNSRQAAYGYDQRVEMLGSAGEIETDNYYPNQAVVSTGKEVRRDLPLNFFMERYTESFAAELRAFVEAVRENRPTPVTGIDGRVPVVMGLAARKSYDEHRPVAWKRSLPEADGVRISTLRSLTVAAPIATPIRAATVRERGMLPRFFLLHLSQLLSLRVSYARADITFCSMPRRSSIG